MTVSAMEFRITGRVQGVSFRAWTREQAVARGLSGWVRNAPDGTVRARLEGPSEALAAMHEALHHGPPGARVEQVEARQAVPDPALADFEILR